MVLKIKHSQVDQEKRGLKEYGDLLKRFWKPNTDDLNFMNVRVQSAKNEKWRRPETPEQGGFI